MGHMDTVQLAGGFTPDLENQQIFDPAPNSSIATIGELFGFGVHIGGGQAGELLHLRLRAPDDSTHLRWALFEPDVHGTRGGHTVWLWNTNTVIGPPGQWQAEVIINDQVVSSPHLQRSSRPL